MSRPEHLAPPEVFYNDDEAKKYTSNSHIIDVQTRLTARAIELLALPDDSPRLILDIGCGSGLSGAVIEEAGHMFFGLDISPSMLDIAAQRDDIDGEMFLADMGQGLPFRPGTFDGAISISALQWLCNADKTQNNPIKRINHFFQKLYAALRRGARAVLQAYPENAQQMELLASAALRAGFGGGWLVDFPNSTRAKKFYLVIWAGANHFATHKRQEMPNALDGEEPGTVAYEQARMRMLEKRANSKRNSVKTRDWVVAKKERQRRQGREVRPDSKYTGRRRKHWQ